MTSPPRTHAVKTVAPEAVSVRFSDEARAVFRDLAAMVHFSDDFDPTIESIVDDIAAGKKIGLSGLLMSMPLIAQETFRYGKATGDERVEKIWRDMAEVFSEHRYTLSQKRQTDLAR